MIIRTLRLVRHTFWRIGRLPSAPPGCYPCRTNLDPPVDPYRVWAAQLFLRVRQLTNLDYTQAGEVIAKARLRARPLQRQTIKPWETGQADGSLANFLVLCDMTGLDKPALTEALMAMLATKEAAFKAAGISIEDGLAETPAPDHQTPDVDEVVD